MSYNKLKKYTETLEKEISDLEIAYDELLHEHNELKTKNLYPYAEVDGCEVGSCDDYDDHNQLNLFNK